MILLFAAIPSLCSESSQNFSKTGANRFLVIICHVARCGKKKIVADIREMLDNFTNQLLVIVSALMQLNIMVFGIEIVTHKK